MRKLILKWFKGIPEEDIEIRMNQEYSKMKNVLETHKQDANYWKGEALAYKNQLENIPAKLDEMKLSRNLKKAIINKLNGN